MNVSSNNTNLSVLVLIFALTNAFYLDGVNEERPARSLTVDSIPKFKRKTEKNQEHKENLLDNHHGRLDNEADKRTTSGYSEKSQIGDDSNLNENDESTLSTTEFSDVTNTQVHTEVVGTDRRCQTSFSIREIIEFCEYLNDTDLSGQNLTLPQSVDCFVKKHMRVLEICKLFP